MDEMALVLVIPLASPVQGAFNVLKIRNGVPIEDKTRIGLTLMN
jgi:hypothetical protein